MSSWNDSLLIGVVLIDDQHRELVKHLDELLEACHSGKGSSEVGHTLKFVVAYIHDHLKDEEELQALYAYPDMDAHKKLHAKFVQNTIDLMQELKSSKPCGDFTDKVRKMLLGWFLTHIKTEDKKLGAYIQERAVSDAEN